MSKYKHYGLLLSAAAMVLMSGPLVWAAVQPDPPSSICINGKCTTAPVTTGALQFKWHPGVYIWPATINTKGNTAQQQADFTFIQSICSNSNIAGVKLVTDWNNLEGDTAGDYSAGFAYVDAYLAQLGKCSTPKRLIVEVFGYRFGNCNGGSPGSINLPAYFSGTDTGSSSMIDVCYTTQRTWSAAIWNAPTMNRLIALSAAYAARYDTNPLFEMFQPMEESIQLIGNTSSGYTNQGAMTQLYSLYAATQTQWTHTLVRLPANFTGDGQDSTMSSLFNTIIGGYNKGGQGLIVGGPDTVPEPNFPINANYVFRGNNSIANGGNGQRNSAYTDYQGVVPWVSEIESTEMCQSGAIYCDGNATLSDEAAYGNNVMKASYWIVYGNTWAGTAAVQLPAILTMAASGGFAVTSSCMTGWSCKTN
jgi:hypothetical protein